VTPANVAFLTNATGTADLSTWALSGGQAGLAGADAICNASAEAAGLKGTFVAWLSDDTNDALCRVNGLSGTVATDCNGELDPLHPAGPWVRTDGLPFAGTMDELLANGPLTPMRYNEYGDEANVNAYEVYFTATEHTDGSLDLGSTDCSNWSDTAAGSVQVGNEDSTGFRWTAYGTVGCGSTHRLVCMQVGSRGPLPHVNMSGRKVFVTNSTGHGDTSAWSGAVSASIEAADEVCQAAAADAGLSNAANFKAWISNSTVNAADRILSDGPWVRLDGFRIADSMADLLDGVLDTSINVTEYGTYDIGYYGGYAWTGTDGAGAVLPETCSDWTDGTGGSSGGLGSIISAGQSLVSPNWTDDWTRLCNYSNYHLYCFED